MTICGDYLVIDMVLKDHAAQADFHGHIVDPDKMVASSLSTAGIVSYYSLDTLRTRHGSITGWRFRLPPTRQGKFIARFPTDAVTERLSSPELLARMSSKENMLFQVVSQPSFTPIDYSRIHLRHLTAGAFIPAAEMTLQQFNIQYSTKASEKTHPSSDAWDWSYKHVQGPPDNVIVLSRADFENGELDEIIAGLEKTDNIVMWENVRKSHQVDSKDPRYLVEADETNTSTMDLAFSTRIGNFC
jgi:hypothetical protein